MECRQPEEGAHHYWRRLKLDRPRVDLVVLDELPPELDWLFLRCPVLLEACGLETTLETR